jgi:hypothetical protein
VLLQYEMINPLAIRGSQLMTNEIFHNKTKILSLIKWFLCVTALVYSIKFPDVIAHSIFVAVHTFYEATSFVLEHFLIHTFGFGKDLAQLIVFYFSVVVGVAASILFWRYWLRDYLIYKLYAFQHQVIYYWHSKRKVEKIKLILIYSALTVSTFMLLIS